MLLHSALTVNECQLSTNSLKENDIIFFPKEHQKSSSKTANISWIKKENASLLTPTTKASSLASLINSAVNLSGPFFSAIERSPRKNQKANTLIPLKKIS